MPGDLAITGWDDVMAARHARPGLTTVRQPMRQLGAAGRAPLARTARGGDTSEPRHEVLPTQLVVRRAAGTTPRRISESQMSHARAGVATVAGASSRRWR